MKLNLGCGSDIKKDFINIDIRSLPGVDLVADITFLPPDRFAPGTVEEINAYDVLEHIPFPHVPKVLGYWISLLQNGGKIIVRVPDLAKILDKFVNGKLPAFEAQRLVFGGQDYEYNFHCAGFTEGMLEGLLLGCGCSEVIQVVREDDSHNVTLVARK